MCCLETILSGGCVRKQQQAVACTKEPRLRYIPTSPGVAVKIREAPSLTGYVGDELHQILTIPGDELVPHAK